MGPCGIWSLKRNGLRRVEASVVKRILSGPTPALDRHARQAQLEVTYYQRMARFLPPRIDVPLTCFIAVEGAPFDTDPTRWREWVPEVRVVPIPGGHTAVITHRAALGELLERAMCGDFHDLIRQTT